MLIPPMVTPFVTLEFIAKNEVYCTMTIRELLTQSTAELKSVNIDTASLDASILLAHTLGIDRSKLPAMNEETIKTETLSVFHALLERRINGECIAYITGKKEFYGLEFMINHHVLVPRPETEMLVTVSREQVTDNSEQRVVRVLDLCTGSGAIAIALKHELPHLEVYATDISAEALEVAKYNASKLLPNNNNISFLQGDLYNALPSSISSLLIANCYLIVSNSPYISAAEMETLSIEVKKEPRLALDGGKDGLEIIERIIKDAPIYLKRGGQLLLEADPRQMEKIKSLLANRGFNDIQLYKDLAGLERVIGGIYI